MRTRYNKDANDIVNSFDRYINSKEKLKEKLNNNTKKIFVEIGMGKGDFITQMALQTQEYIYIGVELSVQVLAIAIKKLKIYEKENNVRLDNLYFMSFDAINLSEIFDGVEVEKLYLNFSDPWPKKRHAKRRLTNERFLKEYKKVLKKDGIIEFKTDNRLLFEYSLVSMQNFGMTFLEVYLDLHKTDVYNIETEYENKFPKNGPIYKLVAKI